ncbi:MAG: hypothetical protein QNJ71_06945, partial [Acidimicrobiia bacterium]|nr:hypothetical protein [Acidimicrobiia bacterium]
MATNPMTLDEGVAQATGDDRGTVPASASARASQFIPSKLIPWVAIAASWTLFRPYPGIVHDAKLYLHYALFRDRAAFPEGDLLVAFDAQMGRSIYVAVITPLIEMLGAARAAVVATVVGLAAWVAGIAALGRVLFGRDWWILAVMAPAFPAHWGPLFALAEPFAAPRALSEGLVLAAVALALADRPLRSVPLLAAAGLFHPLVTIPGVAVVAVIAAFRWKRLIPVLAVGALAGVAVLVTDPLGIAGAGSYDAEWLEIIAGRAFLVLPGEWHGDAWVLITLGFLLSGAGALAGRSRVRLLTRSAGIVGVVALIVSAALAWIVVVPFAVQMQPWRALWLVHVAALVTFVDFGLTAWRSRTRTDVLRALAALGVTLAAGVNVPVGWFVLQVIVSVPFLLPETSKLNRRFVASNLGVLMLISTAGLFIAQLTNAVARIVIREDLASIPWIGYSAALPAVTIALAVLVVAATKAVIERTSPRGGGPTARANLPAIAGAMLLVALTLAAAATWDHRTEWQAFVETVEEPVVELPEDALVLVEDDTIGFVTLLQRPGYYSNYAAAGVAFSRDMAIALRDRGIVARSVGVPWALDWEYGIDPYESWEAPSRGAIRAACSAEGGPTHLFLRRPVTGLEGQVWSAPLDILEIDVDGPNPNV